MSVLTIKIIHNEDTDKVSVDTHIEGTEMGAIMSVYDVIMKDTKQAILDACDEGE